MPSEYDDLIPPSPLLDHIHKNESGGRNLPPEANMNYGLAGPQHSSASGLDQIQPATWKAWAKETGIGQEYARASDAPPLVQDALSYQAAKKYGPNSSYTWAKSAPPGGYKDPLIGKQAAGEYDDLIPKQGAAPAQHAAGEYDDLIPKQATPWRVPPANEGSRAGAPVPQQMGPPQRPPGPMDPSIAARTPQPGAEAQPNPFSAGLHGLASTLASPEQWAAMASDPKNPMWKRVGVGVMELGKRYGQQALNAAGVFGDVATGKARMEDPETQQRVMAAAATFGSKLAPGGLGAVEEAAAPAEASRPNALGSSVGVAGPPPNEASIAARAAQPQSAGAAAVPTHEILAQNVASKESTLAASDPTLKQNMTLAANALKVFTAPETMRNIETGEQSGMEAAASIRKNTGEMERETQIASKALNQYYSTFNGIAPEEGLTVLRWLQNPETRGAGGYEPAPEVKSFMDTFRNEMLNVRRTLESLPKSEDMAFKENFVSQMWQNPKVATQGMMGGKGGSGYFTKKSVWDSYEDGIRQGGIPISTNPLEIGVRYINNANKWIAANRIIDDGAESGRIVWRTPGEQPTGWMQLNGRAQNYKGPGQFAYAPPEYAHVYNNFISQLPQGATGYVIQGLQRAANVTTLANLGLSAFHASLMANESWASGLANAIDNFAGGKIATGMLKTAEAPIYPITSLWRAKQGIDAYFDKSAGGIQTQKAVKALTAANFRMHGRGSVIDDYRTSFLPDLFTSYKKGRLGMEARNAMADIAQHPVLGPGRQIASLALRTLDTASAPIFQYLVPRLKTGAALDMMQTYMRKKPNATDADLATYAARVSNIIDDRFGEMNHDNMFLHKVQKSVMQSLLVSMSYAYGSARSMVGGGADAAKLLKGGGWTPRLSYPIGLFGSMAIGANIYQYLMTGKPTGSARDVTNPQTGGVDPQSGQPARATLPSQLNQVFGLWNNPGAEMGDKLNNMWKTVGSLVSAMGPTGGYDYKNDPLVDKNAPGVSQLAQGLLLAAKNFEPAFFEQQGQPGSAVTQAQRFLGVRDAPRRAVDSEGSKEGLRYVNAQKQVEKKQHEGELPRYLPHAMKRKYIQQEMNRYRGAQ